MSNINKSHPEDFLYMGSGIIVAGNLIVDLLKKIDIYPDANKLRCV